MLYYTPVSFIAKVLNKEAYMSPPISLCHFVIFAISVTTTKQLVPIWSLVKIEGKKKKTDKHVKNIVINTPL
jgi:hypothetical protein